MKLLLQQLLIVVFLGSFFYSLCCAVDFRYINLALQLRQRKYAVTHVNRAIDVLRDLCFHPFFRIVLSEPGPTSNLGFSLMWVSVIDSFLECF